jgi:hypothetical protein
MEASLVTPVFCVLAENLPQKAPSAAMINLSHIQLMLHKLEPGPMPEFRYRKEAA